MQIPGHIDPVTTGTVPLRGGNRIDLVGLTRDAIRAELVEAGLDAKAAKLAGDAGSLEDSLEPVRCLLVLEIGHSHRAFDADTRNREVMP